MKEMKLMYNGKTYTAKKVNTHNTCEGCVFAYENSEEACTLPCPVAFSGGVWVEDTHQYYTTLNAEDAENLVGCVVEVSNTGLLWAKSTLNIISTGSVYTFSTDAGAYPLMRTCKKPKVPEHYPELLSALEKSIQQWEIMLSTGRSKAEVYDFLGGDRSKRPWCFMCDSFCESTERFGSCDRCITWESYSTGHCMNELSPYYKYHVLSGDRNDNIKAVLNKMKEEQERIKKEIRKGL